MHSSSKYNHKLTKTKQMTGNWKCITMQTFVKICKQPISCNMIQTKLSLNFTLKCPLIVFTLKCPLIVLWDRAYLSNHILGRAEILHRDTRHMELYCGKISGQSEFGNIFLNWSKLLQFFDRFIEEVFFLGYFQPNQSIQTCNELILDRKEN